jgi:hypothetical protein
MPMVKVIVGLWLVCFSCSNATADQWGESLCGAKMSLQLETPKKTATNVPAVLVITITNVSDKIISVPYRNLRPSTWFSITSPTGKDLSTQEAQQRIGGSQTVPPSIAPGKIFQCKIIFDSLCDSNESGSYKLTARCRIQTETGDCVLISNELTVLLSENDTPKASSKRGSGF